jgi:hypothetical protein
MARINSAVLFLLAGMAFKRFGLHYFEASYFSSQRRTLQGLFSGDPNTAADGSKPITLLTVWDKQ